MALAVELGQRGIACVVVERHLEVGRVPKGQNLTQRTLEHFYFWGCVEELRAARLLPPGYPIGGLTAYGNLMSDYWYAAVGREAVQPYFFQKNERLPQYLTESVLRERAARLPSVRCLYGWTATKVDQRDNGVRAAIREEASGEEQVLEADYLVGCDGARSLVREDAGIDRKGPDFDQRMVLAVLRSRELHDGLRRFPERTTYRVLHPDLHGYWRFFGRVDVGEGFFFHAPVPRDTVTESYDFQGLLEEAAGFSFSCRFEHLGFWDLRIDVASRYREGRCFIAGDACHSHPPYGGFGLNSGLEDVANLGWKLAAAIEGWGGDRLLDSYTEERQPIFVETGQVIAGGIERDRAFLERYHPDRDRVAFEEAWEKVAQRSQGARSYEPSYDPHYEGSSVVDGPPGATCSVHGRFSLAAEAGHHLAPRALSSGGDVYERLGPAFRLLAFGVEDPAVAPLVAAARSLGVPLEVVRDSYEEDRLAYGSRLILVRPDQYVAWTGDEAPADAFPLLSRVTGR